MKLRFLNPFKFLQDLIFQIFCQNAVGRRKSAYGQYLKKFCKNLLYRSFFPFFQDHDPANKKAGKDQDQCQKKDHRKEDPGRTKVYRKVSGCFQFSQSCCCPSGFCLLFVSI